MVGEQDLDRGSADPAAEILDREPRRDHRARPATSA
jgi:hypothetical protein